MKYKAPSRMSLLAVVLQLFTLKVRAASIAARREVLRDEVIKRLDRASVTWRVVVLWQVRQRWVNSRTIPAHTIEGRWTVLVKRDGKPEITV